MRLMKHDSPQVADDAAVHVLVLLDADRFPEAVRAVRSAGLKIKSEQPSIGTVVGVIAQDRLAALTHVDGVEAVEREKTYRLPGPDSPLQ
ncbi:hypothetical protein [Kitasatospora sp. NPDC050543]|uniref:hypothetical protein n=1 Tax=Kitasatospora sp. NPDC050543 TaxID=3364054 RepID=UPI00378DBE8E